MSHGRCGPAAPARGMRTKSEDQQRMEHEAKQRVQPQKNPREGALRSGDSTPEQNDSFIKISTKYNRSTEVTALPLSFNY
jgi:hypothetical protein